VIRGAVAAASDPAAVSAATDALGQGGSATDAVLAGFGALAGAYPSMLLAPVVGLVAGVGAGARTFDGRTVQPGRGIPRPRGFVEESEVTVASRVGVPRSVAAVYTMHTRFGRLKLRELFAQGVSTAKELGAPERSKLIRAVGDSGVLAFRRPEIQAELVRVAGPVAGGLLTKQDLLDATPEDHDAERIEIADAWTMQRAPFMAEAGRPGHIVVATDGRGTLAALAVTPTTETLPVDALELAFSLDAAPVRRGITRVTPGVARPAPAPIAVLDLPEGARVVLGLVGRATVDESTVRPLVEATLVEMALRALSPLAAVVTDGRDARAVVSQKTNSEAPR